MKFLVIIGAALLAGCASTKPAQSAITVKVPLPVPCKAPKVEKPVWFYTGRAKGLSPFEKVRALRAELEQRKGYERKLEASINACQ